MEICPARQQQKKILPEPDWAKVVLMRMQERGILESDP